MQNKANLGLQINMEQILSLLSASLYKGDVLEVATRELLQNSYDATKQVENPTISFDWDCCTRTLTCNDNGIGMTTDTVKDVFFTVGGTFKEGLDVSERSGGFGIAKVQFFMAAERIQVTSSRNGVRTIATATQQELLSGQGKIETMDAPEDEHGTEVKLQFPESYEDAGEIKELWYSYYSIERILAKPLIGFNGILSLDNRTKSTSVKLTTKVTQSYDWADLEIYFNPKASGSRLYADVHCAGLYQFSWSEYLASDEGIECLINVKPKYPAGHMKYAFANSRDNFSGYAKNDLEEVKKALHELTKCIKAEKVRSNYADQVQLTYTDVHSSVQSRAIVGESNRPKIDFEKLCQGKSITEMLEILSKVFAQLAEEAKARAEQKEDAKETCLKFINKTDKDLSHCYEAFSKISSIIFDIIYNNDIKPNSSRAKTPTIAGVLVENGTRGCCLTLDSITGIYLNPMGYFINANHFASVMTETLIHELAHLVNSYHEDSFFVEMGRVKTQLFEYNLYEELYSKFQSIYVQYGQDFAV
jgi:hypothetical protein